MIAVLRIRMNADYPVTFGLASLQQTSYCNKAPLGDVAASVGRCDSPYKRDTCATSELKCGRKIKENTLNDNFVSLCVSGATKRVVSPVACMKRLLNFVDGDGRSDF